MEEYKNIVNEKIKSGEYFSEALSWYNSRFVRPKTDLIHMSLMAAICIFLFIVSVITFATIFPITKKESFIVSRALNASESIKISALNTNVKNPTLGVLTFLIREYVTSREEYLEERINRNFRFVTELSDENVFDLYMNETDISNPNNPILLYGNQAKIDVKITKLIMPKLPEPSTQIDFDKEYKAKVLFTSNLKFLDGDSESRKMQADVTFKYKEISVNQKTHVIKQLPELIVTGYKTRQL